MSEDQAAYDADAGTPKMVDKRAGRRAIIDAPTDYSKQANRLANVRWALGTNPHDELAIDHSQELIGWTDYKLEYPEHEQIPVDTTPRSTTPSGIACWRCRGEQYRIIDERTPAQVAAARDDVAWALSQNRVVDPKLFPRVLLLSCPRCGHKTQMDEETVHILASRQSKD